MWNSGQTAEDEDGEDAAAMTEAQSAESAQSGAAANSYEVRDTDAYYDSDEEPYIPLGAYGYPGLRGSEAVRARARVAIQPMRESGVCDALPPPVTPPRNAPPPWAPPNKAPPPRKAQPPGPPPLDDPVARASMELDARMAAGGASAVSARMAARYGTGWYGGPEDEVRDWCEVCGRLDRCQCEATRIAPKKMPRPMPKPGHISRCLD